LFSGFLWANSALLSWTFPLVISIISCKVNSSSQSWQGSSLQYTVLFFFQLSPVKFIFWNWIQLLNCLCRWHNFRLLFQSHLTVLGLLQFIN
jgi:hypothetical protein